MGISNLPVDLSFTVATTAIADMFGDRATTNVVAGAGGNDAIKAITDEGWSLADLGIQIPTDDFWVTSFNLETDTACVIQLGLIYPDSAPFIPLDTHVCTKVAAGGIVKPHSPGPGIFFPITSQERRFGLKVSGYGGATSVRITGNLDIARGG